MKLNRLVTKKGLVFLLIFSALVFVGDKINFSRLAGADSQFFTLFQFFGPLAGYFLGPVVGVLSVLIAEIASKAASHSAFDVVTVLRLTPMLFAAWYFGSKRDKLSIAVPVLAILAFIAHPVGRQVWYFSLFWTIPIVIKMASGKMPERYVVNGTIIMMLAVVLITNRNLITILSVVAALVIFNLFPEPSLKGIGATFTAHAVGGAIWNYVVPMTPSMWIALIPIVIFERLIFASGISLSFVGINTLLNRLDKKTKSEYLSIDKKYILFKQAA